VKELLKFLLIFSVLFFLVSLGLRACYGQSFTLFLGEDCWIPDGNGGWAAHGNPIGPSPNQPSVNVPSPAVWAPIWLPLLLTTATFLLFKQKAHPLVKD
jgi:hypothetical protein